LHSELSRLDDVEVTRVNSEADLDRCCANADLLLVNREPVGFDEDGLTIVRNVCKKHPDARVRLVSDLPDAQAEAESAGALPGFGKRLMGTPKLQEAVLRGLQG
jgi:hypothetical protein